MKINDLKNKIVHFVGVGGISMSGLSIMLKNLGAKVQGSDQTANAEVVKLQKKGIAVFVGHRQSNVKNADAVVYSSAISDDNPEIVYAKKQGLTLIKRAELLALIASYYDVVISVAGSHGKTTTTAMISEIFLNANKKPTIHLGGVLNKLKSNYKIGNKKFFITESCEYKDNFLFLKPDISVILNIDADHLDYFGSLDGVKNSFLKFSQNTNPDGLNILCGDDENSKFLKTKQTLIFGEQKGNICARRIKEYETGKFAFNVIFEGYNLGRVKLNILGKHNVYNALASILVSLLCGIDFCDIKSSLENFSGTKRRTEKIENNFGLEIFHDYAHHPKQIEEMLKIGRELADKNNAKLLVIFEPHTYSRTKFLIDDFAKSFSLADEVIFAPVYSAREDPSAGLGPESLANKTKKYVLKTTLLNSFEEIKSYILATAKRQDVVFILGAGTIEKLAQMLKK